MFTRLTQVKNYIFAHKIVSVVVIVVILGVGGSLLRPAAPPNLSTAMVERKTLVQSVEETGSLETGLEVSYGFETSGRVVSVSKKAGDIVALNDVLAELDGRNERASLSAAQASYAGALADLNRQLAGGSDEDRRSAAAKVDEAEAYLAQAEADRDQTTLDAQNALDAAQTAVDKAKNNLQLAASGSDSLVVRDAYDDLLNALYSVLSDMDEASTQVDTVLGYDSVYANDAFESVGSFPASSIQSAITAYKTTKEYTRLFESALDTASVSKKQVDIDLATSRAQNALSQMRNTIRSVFVVLNEVIVTESSLQPTLDGIISNIQATQSAINVSVATLTTATQAVTTAKNSVSTYQLAYDQAVRDFATATKQKETTIKNAQSVVDLRRAGLDAAQAAYDKVVNPPREIDLASLRAEVSRRGAEVSARQDAFAKTKLIARTSGVVGKMDIRVGENAVVNKDIVTLLSENYLIKVDISESDIIKVSVGDSVSLMFDAVPNHTFTGSVVEIDESKTEISGVVYYKTTIALSSEDSMTEQLRSGMTVDVSIETERKDSVLVAPRRAIITRDNKKFIRVVTNKERGTFEEREVQTGLSGDDGLVEIVSGLEEGQEVVTFIEETK
jgi:RND family efflux transporter MFP subunit